MTSEKSRASKKDLTSSDRLALQRGEGPNQACESLGTTDTAMESSADPHRKTRTRSKGMDECKPLRLRQSKDQRRTRGKEHTSQEHAKSA